MAEAFGVGAGIASVLGLTIQIAQVVTQFGLDWKAAPTEVKGFMNELQNLKTVLSETEANFLHDPNFKEAFQGRPSILLSELGPNAPSATETKLSIASCKEELKRVRDGLNKRDKGSRMGWERFKGPFLAKSTRDSVDKLRNCCQRFNNMVSMDALTLGVKTHKEMIEAIREQQQWHNDKQNQEILTWISNLSFDEKQTDILSKRHPGTGQWLLNQERFQIWRNGVRDEPSLLWCPGMPGAGKSVMTAIVIDHLQQFFAQENVSISYIYCDHKDRKTQTTVNLISSLVKQVILQQRDMPREVIDLYARCKNGQSSLSLEDHSQLLSSFSNHFRRSFILVDALDEHLISDDEDNAMQLTLLDTFLNLQHHGSSSGCYTLFFTSRIQSLIESHLAGFIRLDIRATDSDIESYLRSRIYDPTKFTFAQKVQDDANLGNEIVRRLVQKAQGMFLLPYLHLNRLGCQTSVRNLREELKTLPTKLNKTYEDAMARIQGQVQEHSSLALSALSWISTALRPLRTDELQHALAVRLGDQSLDEDGLVDEALIISVSAGMITLDAQSRTFRLVHFTVEEFFKGTHLKWFPDADRQIAEACLTYLSFDIFESGPCPPRDLKARLQENNFLDYAARNWGYHISRAKEHTIEDLTLDFLGNDRKVSCSSQVMLQSRYWLDSPSQVSGAHLAVHFGSTSIMTKILELGIVADSEDSNGHTPLSYAVAEGHETIVKLLVDRDDVAADSKDHIRRTPLSRAAARGYEKIVKLFVDRDDVVADSRDRFGRTPLSYAAAYGYEAVVKLLVDRDDVVADSRDKFGQTPLSYAAENGYKTVVKFFVDRNDVTADSRDRDGRTPLSLAVGGARFGVANEKVVEFLMNQDDVVADSRDNNGRTPLSFAAEAGHETVVKLLMSRDDVAVDSEDNSGNTPLSYATRYRHKTGRGKTVVKLLEEGLQNKEVE